MNYCIDHFAVDKPVSCCRLVNPFAIIARINHVYVISKELRTILLEATIANAHFTLFL